MFAPALTFTTPSHNLLAGTPFGHHARMLAELASRARPQAVLYVAADDMAAAVTAQLIAFFAPFTEIISLPAWDCLPYDRISPSASCVAQRVDALTTLLRTPNQPRVVITTAAGLLQKVPAPEVFRDISFSLHVGDQVDSQKLKSFLAGNGFTRVDTVREAGEFAFRGSIIDIFPPGTDEPLRLDLFGEEVEALRAFDPATQRTSERRDACVLKPVSEILFDAAAIQRFRTGYREAFGVTVSDPLYASVSEGRRYPGMEHWLPLFHARLVPMTDYMPRAILAFDAGLDAALEARHAQIDDFYAARKALQQADKKSGQPLYRPLPPATLYIDKNERAGLVAQHAAVSFSPFPAVDGQQNVVDCAGRQAQNFSALRATAQEKLYDHVKTVLEKEAAQKPVLLACYSQGSADRLQRVLKEHGLAAITHAEKWGEEKKRGVYLAIMPLEHGFYAPDMLVLTEQDILGDRLARPKAKRGKSDSFSLELSGLHDGDLVVHAEHGIGRYAGLETLEVSGAPHDCLRVLYDGGDKLYVPVENLDILSRYGSSTDGTKLDKLGSAAWQGRKARVKKRLMDMAEALLKLAAERQLQDGEKIIPPDGLYQEFAARFPYAETEDQERAIMQVLDDLASGKPMDRLVCGDVGFGKTEVAIRAAFAAWQAGLQVAVVVPTTLLARQHFRTFRSRFHGMPIRLAQLSRMVGVKESRQAKDLIRDGKIDIVVGTHALLAKDIQFKQLGLLIVDEEQHFGVKQKEKLKELRTNVHVLTLTATPIPRTLQLALTGVRELSLITTPPVDRLAVRSFVLPYDSMVIREALMREHYRSGQSFYVCPRIEDLATLREQLQALVPELKIITAHGRLSAAELEEVMTAFDEAKYDVLLATNIVESGLDIPNANTIILHRADMFGLAQLYQLRGRVGRAKQRGYAYFTYDGAVPLSATSQKRLEVLATLEGLGAGFQLASHDMDIRGAGNLLGEEQSGHIREVGIELFQQMLEDAVAQARAGGMEAAYKTDRFVPQINLGIPVLIPETYVADLGLRLNLYRRAADLHDDSAREAFAAELIDRFGPLPPEVQNLLDIMALKELCRRAGLEKLDAGPKGAVLSLRGNAFARPEKLISYIQKNSGTIKVQPDQKISIIRPWNDASARLKGVVKIVGELAGLVRVQTQLEM